MSSLFFRLSSSVFSSGISIASDIDEHSYIDEEQYEFYEIENENNPLSNPNRIGDIFNQSYTNFSDSTNLFLIVITISTVLTASSYELTVNYYTFYFPLILM